MRLSEWSAVAPTRAAVAPKVLAVAGARSPRSGRPPIRTAGSAGATIRRSAGCSWPPRRPASSTAHVRVNVPQEGPRAAAKLVRWSRVQLGEVAVEAQGAHRLISATVEGVVLRGADAEADAVGAFLQALLAAIDGRPLPAREASPPVASTDA